MKSGWESYFSSHLDYLKGQAMLGGILPSLISVAIVYFVYELIV